MKALLFTAFLLAFVPLSHAEAISKNTVTAGSGFSFGEKFSNKIKKFEDFYPNKSGGYTRTRAQDEITIKTTHDKKIYSITEREYYNNKDVCAAAAFAKLTILSTVLNFTIPNGKEIANQASYSASDLYGGKSNINCVKEGERWVLVIDSWNDKIKNDIRPKRVRNADDLEIEGAFGFKLGEKFDLSRKDYIVSEKLKNGFPSIIALYKNIERPFQFYKISLNPKDGTIVIIAASAQFSNNIQCKEALDAYGKVVEKKYNREVSHYSPNIGGEALFLDKDDKTIVMSCTSDNEYFIAYMDNFVKEEVEDTKSTIQAENIDSSLF